MSVLWKNRGLFRVKKFAFYKKKGCFSASISVNRGRFFTWRTLICPMFYMRVRGPGHTSIATQARVLALEELRLFTCNDRTFCVIILRGYGVAGMYIVVLGHSIGCSVVWVIA